MMKDNQDESFEGIKLPKVEKIKVLIYILMALQHF